MLVEAVGYAENRHWEVAPGAWLIDDGGGGVRCSCGDRRCTLPGAHPLDADWARTASAGPGAVRSWWTDRPRASILLPTGRSFDVLDVPETAGCLALARMERMDLQLGPVVVQPAASGRIGRRLHFLVLPGAAARLPEMLRRSAGRRAGWTWSPGARGTGRSPRRPGSAPSGTPSGPAPPPRSTAGCRTPQK